MLGKNVSAYPEVVQKVHKDGHAIGYIPGITLF